jgi:hypothetical protein
MLVSHKYKFIFFKTVKTASSSVFEFFTPFCLPKNINYNQKDYLQDKYLGFYNTGIIGNPNYKHRAKRRHVYCRKVKKILDNIDSDIWNNYFKFCVVRNPWDLCVSRYFYHYKEKFVKSNFKKMIEDMDSLIANKTKVLFALGSPKRLYKINNKYICDYHIKYEELKNGIIEVCNKCGIKDYDLNNLPNFKSGFRDKSVHYSEYYDDYLKKLVEKMYEDDIKKFNYKFESK